MEIGRRKAIYIDIIDPVARKKEGKESRRIEVETPVHTVPTYLGQLPDPSL